MSLNMNVNVTALRASNSLQSHYTKLSESINRLSTGKKVNSSEDDPVQMANHNIYEGKIAVYEKGLINLQEAISLTQTAESSISSINEQLVRMKELAEQVSSGTYTNEQRTILQSEFSMLAIEIDRIASSADFKGTHLLDGSISTRNNIDRMGTWYRPVAEKLKEEDLNSENDGLKLHFGDSNRRTEDYYFFSLDDMRMEGLFKDYKPGIAITQKLTISTQEAAQNALTAINTAMAVQEKNRMYAGMFQNRLTAAMNNIEDRVYRIKDIDSKITDVDIAMEMTNYTSYQIMAEAATSMLAQANALPQMALKLLTK